MQSPFPDNMTDIAESMGVALYQRFTLNEAALFLRCQLDDLQALVKKNQLEYIQVTESQVEFFGYQLLQHLLASIKGKPTPVFEKSDTDRILRAREVQELTGLSRTTIWRMERKGEFPARVPLSAGSVGWRLSEVEGWMIDR